MAAAATEAQQTGCGPTMAADAMSDGTAVRQMYNEYGAVYAATSRHDVTERAALHHLLGEFRESCLQHGKVGHWTTHGHGEGEGSDSAAANLPSSCLVVDVGCGSGAALQYLVGSGCAQEAGDRCTDSTTSQPALGLVGLGVEPSEELVLRARRLLQGSSGV
eukprot:SAG11_NODE_1570_length_4660_cov_6.671991_4_plen_162_part_00